MDKQEFNQLFGEFVQYKRSIEKGWSQTDLALRMSNNFQNISRLERGKVSPTLYWFRGLAEAFEINNVQFYTELEKFIEQRQQGTHMIDINTPPVTKI